MKRVAIAKLYLKYLEGGEMEKVIKLFSQTGIVHSPLYGSKSANDFYYSLANDTRGSKLSLKGIFEENESNKLALYFNYQWTLKNGKIVEFDVVDILSFNNYNKIDSVKIIYDSANSRSEFEQLTSK